MSRFGFDLLNGIHASRLQASHPFERFDDKHARIVH